MSEYLQFLLVAIGMVLALGGVTFKLVLSRMDKQEARASEDIRTLREEIKTTKTDAKDAVSAAAVASNAAVAATASALRDAVASAQTSAKDAVAATASALSEKINALDGRIEKIEDRAYNDKGKA